MFLFGGETETEAERKRERERVSEGLSRDDDGEKVMCCLANKKGNAARV